MKRTFFGVYCLLAVCVPASSNGIFYVGLLGYINIGNLDFNGQCCDGVLGTNGTCTDYCDLIFEVSVSGLNSSVTSKRPSQNPIDDKTAILFPSAYEGVVNPMTFDFTMWPGQVNVTVAIYDKDEGDISLALVDKFHFIFRHDGPTLHYIYQSSKGQRSTHPSELRIVFRYVCDPTYYGRDCFTDCLVHPLEEDCPKTSPGPVTESTYTFATKEPTTTPCKIVGIPGGNESSQDCPPGFGENATHSSTTLVTTHASTFRTSHRPYLDSSNASITDEVTKLPTALTNRNNQSSETTTVSGGSSKRVAFSTGEQTHSSPDSSSKLYVTTEISASAVKTSQTALTAKTKSSIISTSTDIQSTPNIHGTLPNETPTEAGEPMDYWPAIVGGVLGGVALIVAIGVFMYYRRQKKIKKRQDIYNVNPKILRNFDELSENGTSGRSDVAIEPEEA